MKQIFVLFLLAFMAGLSSQTIVLPANPTQAEKRAADELSHHLSKMLGKPVPMATELKPGNSPRIYVGNTKFAGKKTFATEEWQIIAKGKDAIVLQGGNPNGILYAAWDFLEHYGVLWLDEETTHIPRLEKLEWKADWKVTGKPAFEIRGIYSYLKEGHLRQPNYLFQMRNKLNMVTPPRGYKIAPNFGAPRHCHTYAAYTKDWKGKELECFAMNKDGKRLPPADNQIHGQICFTNPMTLQLFAKKLREFIKKDRAKGIYANVYDVSQNDNSDECYCPGCQNAKKKYGSFGGVILEFTNRLAEDLKKDYPEIKIQMFAYHTAAKVPVNIKAHKNVIVRIPLMGAEFLGVQTRDTSRPLTHPNNKRDLDIFLGWKNISTIAIWDYWIMFKNNGIASYHKTIAENIRLYKSWGAMQVFAECEYPLNNLFYCMRIWLGARLLVNPNLDEKEEISCFLNAYYGKKAAPYMQQLLDYVQKRNDSVKYSLSRMVLAGRPDLDQEFFRHAGALIERALGMAETDEQRKHIRKERLALHWDNLVKFRGKAHPDMKFFQKRLLNDFALIAPMFTREIERKKLLKDLELLFEGVNVKIKPPVGFDDYEILHDITWPRLRATVRGTELVDMPDAAAGKAIRKADTDKYSGVSFGLYDPVSKKHIVRISIPKGRIAQDEKFHYYSLGEVELTPQAIFWAHPTWGLNHGMNAYYSRILFEDNFCEIFVSLKAEGPNYVKGSKKPNTLTMDRILLVRPKNKKK